ncbi:MAG: hypothetical protein EOO83_01320 [Oxalobacteraceae bacterium]|nr:MAG: hypothetical protein EOO83_01320 [Oxalobacteraceae bacterium]
MDRLIRGSSVYDVKRAVDGFILVGRRDRLDEFSHVVREAAAQSGNDFVVFATTDGSYRYSQMFVMPFDDKYSRPPPS